jgi:RNA polymerase sigma factor (TIGR02999 family)
MADSVHAQSVQDALMPMYQQLRAIARARLAGRDAGTLQATAVVHEAILKLSGRPADSFNDDRHLLACAAQAIRHVVVDYARRKRAAKRGSGQFVEDATEQVIDLRDAAKLDLVVDLDQAMQSLDEVDPELRTIVELFAFGGMTHAEIASLLQTSERTVRRRWQFASAELRLRLKDWKATSAPTDTSHD